MLVLLSLLAVPHVYTLSPDQWRSLSIYQVLTDRFARTDGSTTASCNAANGIYCGGSFQGLIDHLDYIQDMGFTAVSNPSAARTEPLSSTNQVWISPVVENLPQDTSDGEGYHGYWAQNIYEINSNFGTSADLQGLSSALHSRNMVR